MNNKHIVYDENGNVQKFLVPENIANLIYAINKHYKWIKNQTLSEKLSLCYNIPEENVTIEITW